MVILLVIVNFRSLTCVDSYLGDTLKIFNNVFSIILNEGMLNCFYLMNKIFNLLNFISFK